MSKSDNMHFLQSMNEKIVRWSSLQEMACKADSSSLTTEFNNIRFSKQEFKRVLEIIEEELLVMLPNQSTETGFIGYVVYDLDGKVVLEFSERNIPDGFSIEKIFTQVCHSDQNKELLQQLADDGILAAQLHETFAEYCSGNLIPGVSRIFLSSEAG